MIHGNGVWSQCFYSIINNKEFFNNEYYVFCFQSMINNYYYLLIYTQLHGRQFRSQKLVPTLISADFKNRVLEYCNNS